VEIIDKQTNVLYGFPVYQWIDDKMINVPLYNAQLPQFADDETSEMRKELIKKDQNDYQWVILDGLPPRIKNLPKDDEFSKAYVSDIVQEVLKGKMNEVLTKLFLMFDPFNSIDDYKLLYFQSGFTIPEIHNTWTEDKDFGIQRLQGTNPLKLERFTSTPQNFAINNEMMQKILETNSGIPGATINSEIERKRLYYCDYSILVGIAPNTSCGVLQHCCSPFALFQLDKNDDLLPIAIQLEQKPSDDNPVFLPTDDPNLWLLAKNLCCKR